MSDETKLLCVKALEIKRCGYNCAQSVIGAFAQLVGIDEDFALKISSAFGGGMKHEQLCGALVGAGMALGACYGFCDAADQDGQEKIKELTLELVEKFKEKNKTTICGELLASSPDSFICDIELANNTPNENKQYCDNPYNIRAPICGTAILDAVTIAANLMRENL